MGEHFIPFRKADIAAMCAEQLPAAERESFLDLTRMVSSVAHYQFHERIEALKDAYHPFNPEADTRAVAPVPAEDRRAAQERLESELERLAVAANFTEISEAEVEAAFNRHSLLRVRLDVDKSVIDKVLFFRRGESRRRRKVPIWFGLRRREVEFTNYARVLVYARFKNDLPDAEKLPFRPGSTVIKLFQNVPLEDLEMVFPNVQVRMRGVDKLFIGVPAVFSFGVVAAKLAGPVLALAVLLGVWLGITDGEVSLEKHQVVAMGAGLFALGGYFWRQFNTFKNRKIQFMKALSENLYFRNLDNDAGVFHHLLDAAEEAEVIETVLAYRFLHTSPGITQAELDRLIEEFFSTRWSEKVNFEVEDGLRKLRELRLLEEHDGRLSVVSLDEARRRLDHAWDNVFVHNAPARNAPAAFAHSVDQGPVPVS